MFDVIMPVSRQHNDIAPLAIQSLIKNFLPRNVYVIASCDNLSLFTKLQNLRHVTVMDENSFIPGINLQAIAEFIENRGQNSSRAGWYFQQFLKMSACFLPNISSHFLIWDADTIMLKPMSFINDRHQIMIQPSSEYHQPYFDTYYNLLGQNRSVDFSFISEHFFINTQHMKELIAAIEQSMVPGNHWVWKIMNSIEKKHLSGSGFSEYETYGNYVNTVHPGSFLLRPLKTLRQGSQQFGRVPSKYDLYRLSLSYSYASFENWNKGNPLRIFTEKLLSVCIYYTHRATDFPSCFFI